MKTLLWYAMLLWYETESWLLKIIPSKKEDAILIVRSDNLGDFLLFLDTAKEYKKQSNKKIILLCKNSVKLIAERFSFFDEIINFDEKSLLYKPLYRLKFFLRLRQREFSIAVNPVFSRDYFLNDLTIRNIKAEKKTAFDGDYTNTVSRLRFFGFSDKKKNDIKRSLKAKANKFYSEILIADNENKSELNRNAEFLEKFFNIKYSSSVFSLPFEIERKENLPEDYALIFIGGSSKNKIWQEENFAQLIKNIDKEIVICGDKNDVSVSKNIISLVGKGKKILDLTGKTSLWELFAVINQASFMVSNDTVASHIAPIVKTPSVVILPGAFFGRFHPYETGKPTDEAKKYFPKAAYYKTECYGCKNICIKVKDKNTLWPCVAGVSVSQVVELIKEIS
ncbi:MAG: glycosyltransferase family 9 protein [Bacteroidales bacterium]|nr:glycosyltransferase family 9 protein [Bacteroidales bacterium]